MNNAMMKDGSKYTKPRIEGHLKRLPIKRTLLNRFRLWRIERALGFKLWPEVREYIWGGAYRFTGRRSGKTVAANVYFLMWHRGTVDFRSYRSAPENITGDPDWILSKYWSVHNLLEMQRTLKEKHIKVVQILT